MIKKILVLCYILFIDFVYTYDNTTSITNESSNIHIVYALDHQMITLTMISVKSIIDASLLPSTLSFHFVTIGMSWNAKFLNEMRLSLGATSNFEAVTWSPPTIIKHM